MRRTEFLQSIRQMNFEDILERTQRRDLSQSEAASLLGMSERTLCQANMIRASGKDDIAAWFIDTDYDEESFFVRHAYFLGANDPYKSLKSALKAEIDPEAWASLYRDVSEPFAKPATGRFAVKVINHFGDEVMKVFGV